MINKVCIISCEITSFYRIVTPKFKFSNDAKIHWLKSMNCRSVCSINIQSVFSMNCQFDRQSVLHDYPKLQNRRCVLHDYPKLQNRRCVLHDYPKLQSRRCVLHDYPKLQIRRCTKPEIEKLSLLTICLQVGTCLLITFANCLNPDQVGHPSGSKLFE